MQFALAQKKRRFLGVGTDTKPHHKLIRVIICCFTLDPSFILRPRLSVDRKLGSSYIFILRVGFVLFTDSVHVVLPLLSLLFYSSTEKRIIKRDFPFLPD